VTGPLHGAASASVDLWVRPLSVPRRPAKPYPIRHADRFAQLFFHLDPSAQPGEYDDHAYRALGDRGIRDVFTDEDLRQINRTMVAHADRRVWDPFLNRVYPPLADLPCEWGLFEALSPSEWAVRERLIRAALSALTEVRGIAAAQATKILHIKRPGLIPIIDSSVAHALNVAPPSEGASLEGAMIAIRLIRDMGQSQPDTVAAIGEGVGGLGLPYEPTAVRLLDGILWAWKDARYRAMHSLLQRWFD